MCPADCFTCWISWSTFFLVGTFFCRPQKFRNDVHKTLQLSPMKFAETQAVKKAALRANHCFCSKKLIVLQGKCNIFDCWNMLQQSYWWVNPNFCWSTVVADSFFRRSFTHIPAKVDGSIKELSSFIACSEALERCLTSMALVNPLGWEITRYKI